MTADEDGENILRQLERRYGNLRRDVEVVKESLRRAAQHVSQAKGRQGKRDREVLLGKLPDIEQQSNKLLKLIERANAYFREALDKVKSSNG
jgi:hypothetical protein